MSAQRDLGEPSSSGNQRLTKDRQQVLQANKARVARLKIRVEDAARKLEMQAPPSTATQQKDLEKNMAMVATRKNRIVQTEQRILAELSELQQSHHTDNGKQHLLGQEVSEESMQESISDRASMADALHESADGQTRARCYPSDEKARNARSQGPIRGTPRGESDSSTKPPPFLNLCPPQSMKATRDRCTEDTTGMITNRQPKKRIIRHHQCEHQGIKSHRPRARTSLATSSDPPTWMNLSQDANLPQIGQKRHLEWISHKNIAGYTDISTELASRNSIVHKPNKMKAFKKLGFSSSRQQRLFPEFSEADLKLPPRFSMLKRLESLEDPDCDSTDSKVRLAVSTAKQELRYALGNIHKRRRAACLSNR